MCFESVILPWPFVDFFFFFWVLVFGCFCGNVYWEGSSPLWCCFARPLIGVLGLYGSISAGLYGSGCVAQIKVSREMAECRGPPVLAGCSGLLSLLQRSQQAGKKSRRREAYLYG